MRANKGSTLIELVMLVAILGVVAAVAETVKITAVLRGSATSATPQFNFLNM